MRAYNAYLGASNCVSNACGSVACYASIATTNGLSNLAGPNMCFVSIIQKCLMFVK